MTDTIAKVRQHYDDTSLTGLIRSALAAIAPDDQPLTVAQLAPLDQFHVRGILATTELAAAARITPADRVLDLGCGIGGPARYLAATFGCRVTGVDLSPAFVETAGYLTARCGLAGRTTFQSGDALHLPFAGGSFDVVFLQHVVMNIADRAALYNEVRRTLAPSGRFVIHDIVLRGGGIIYPVPWARDASTSFLLTEADTRQALAQAGFQPAVWRDDTGPALDWVRTAMAGAPPGPNVALIMGQDWPAMFGNAARGLQEGSIGVLSAVLT